MSNLCPSFRPWTETQQQFDKVCSFPGQTLYLDNHWTNIGQRLDKVWTVGQSLDRDWTKIEFSVQCLSNHTITRSTANAYYLYFLCTCENCRHPFAHHSHCSPNPSGSTTHLCHNRQHMARLFVHKMPSIPCRY